MIIHLTTGKNITGALYYNEQKVGKEKGKVLTASGFANNELAQENRKYADSVLVNQSEKNKRVVKPTLHFSLSLHPSEEVSDDRFKAIAYQFMDNMGYKNQPYIVYRHFDTAHPHIHIVTTCVDDTGNKISDKFIKYKCDAVREKLELRFGLIVAKGRNVGSQVTKNEQITTKVQGEKARTKALETKQQIEKTLTDVLKKKPFNSLEALKEELQQHNIKALITTYNRNGTTAKGISYQLIGAQNKPISPIIKGSEVGKWASAKGVLNYSITSSTKSELSYKVMGKDQERPFKKESAILSDAFREYKRENRYYYDSLLIENFPYEAMVKALQKAMPDINEETTKQAVDSFLAYKVSQLPAIIEKERALFQKRTAVFTELAGTIEGSSKNKLAFLRALNLNVNDDGLVTSFENKHLSYTINPGLWLEILNDSGPSVKIPKVYSKSERTIFLQQAAGKESYMSVRGPLLENVLGREKMATIHTDLNRNYSNELAKTEPLITQDRLKYYFHRGMIVDNTKSKKRETDHDSTYVMRYCESPEGIGEPVKQSLEPLLNTVNIQRWNEAIQTEAGQYMVSLAKLMDQHKAEPLNKNVDDALTYLREKLTSLDGRLQNLSHEDLLKELERRCLQGKGYVREIEPTHQQLEHYNFFTLLTINSNDLFGYEQTGKYKHLGKSVKKKGKSKGREL